MVAAISPAPGQEKLCQNQCCRTVTDEPVIQVALNVPLSRTFDYLPSSGPPSGPPATPSSEPLAAGRLVPGVRVRVPFGRRQQIGLIVGIAESSPLPRNRLKRVLAVIDETPLLGDRDLWLIRFTSDYYHHPIGEVAAAALPALLRQGRPLRAATVRFAATGAADDVDVEALAKRAPRQAGLLTALRDAGGDGIDVDRLNATQPGWRRVIKALTDKGLATRFEARSDTPEPASTSPATAGPVLNAEQQSAVETVRKHQGFGAFVLDGVTGSGKTEVYLHLIERAHANGRQVLVLVPEIGLTPQLVSRFKNRLGVEPALLHSALGDRERLDAWRRARDGSATLIVGTRSAVFVPLARPGLIVVDEEHDHSLKQHEGLRYSARDLAIARAAEAAVPIVLGSATPSLELLSHCRDGRYTHLSLPRRAGAARPPRIELVDLSLNPGSEGLSKVLADAIERHLTAGGQALLYLNRRGFAPTLICTACGHVAECARCDARMTVHAGEARLRCHHCGASRPLDTACGECGAEVRPLGAGTQRLEGALNARFPAHRVRRIDSDSTQAKGAMQAALAEAVEGEADILVGTQMLSKGHHFPKLTLVGIVNADQGLFGTDFRADERLAQSIVQVAGRAGREDRRGEVLIQTAFPAHTFWKRLIDGGYPAVAELALEERQAALWPPFSRLALIRSSAHKHQDARAFLEFARAAISAAEQELVQVLGPVDAPLARRAGRHRAQLLLRSRDRGALHALLRRLRPLLEDSPAARRVRWSVDVDPLELF